MRLARPAWAGAALLGLLALSALLRTRALGASLWIDEGISAGIASHPAGEIPGLLRQDGSPPAYYLLLHAWTELAGTSEAALRAPSLVFALLTVPAALWAGWSLFGRKAGWICAAAAAVLPFLTEYAQEARMYALVASSPSSRRRPSCTPSRSGRGGTSPVRARACPPPLHALLGALPGARGIAGARWRSSARRRLGSARPGARRRARVRLRGAGFAFWVPTLAFQLDHTGAPWSSPPPAAALLAVAGLALAAAAARLPARGRDADGAGRCSALALLAAVRLAAGWASAALEPAGPVATLRSSSAPCSCSAERRSRASAPSERSPRRRSAARGRSPRYRREEQRRRRVGGRLHEPRAGRPGRLDTARAGARARHYLPDDASLRDAARPSRRPRGHGLARRAPAARGHAAPDDELAPLLDALPPGGRILLVAPDVDDGSRWRAPWTRLVALRSGRVGVGAELRRALPAAARLDRRHAHLEAERAPDPLREDRWEPWKLGNAPRR